MVSHPVLINIVEGCNTLLAAHVNIVFYRNLPSCATRLSQNRDFLFKHVNLPSVPITAINGVMNSSWHQCSLEENSHNFNKVTTILNFIAPLITSVERGIYKNLTSRVQNDIAETQLDQIEANRSQRSMDSFIMGFQCHRLDGLEFIANLTCNSWFYVLDQHLAKNCPLIIKFFMEFADILASQKFRE